jgi:hypothetical protein
MNVDARLLPSVNVVVFDQRSRSVDLDVGKCVLVDAVAADYPLPLAVPVRSAHVAKSGFARTNTYGRQPGL